MDTEAWLASRDAVSVSDHAYISNFIVLLFQFNRKSPDNMQAQGA